jgi:ferredoxin
MQTVFSAKLCIECDACIDICPVDCLTIAPNGPRTRTALAAQGAGDEHHASAVRVSSALAADGRVMVKDEDVCVHCGLCAERCPTAAWDMQKSTIKIPLAADEASMPNLVNAADRVNDFVVKFANVNGTGSASANSLIMKAIFRMGVPVTGRIISPPTFRACRPGTRSA